MRHTYNPSIISTNSQQNVRIFLLRSDPSVVAFLKKKQASTQSEQQKYERAAADVEMGESSKVEEQSQTEGL